MNSLTQIQSFGLMEWVKANRDMVSGRTYDRAAAIVNSESGLPFKVTRTNVSKVMRYLEIPCSINSAKKDKDIVVLASLLVRVIEIVEAERHVSAEDLEALRKIAGK